MDTPHQSVETEPAIPSQASPDGRTAAERAAALEAGEPAAGTAEAAAEPAERELSPSPRELYAATTEVPAGLSCYSVDSDYTRYAESFWPSDSVFVLVIGAGADGFRIGEHVVAPQELPEVLALHPEIQGMDVKLVVPRTDTVANPVPIGELERTAELVLTGAQAIADRFDVLVGTEVPGLWITRGGKEFIAYWQFGHDAEPWVASPHRGDPPSSTRVVIDPQPGAVSWVWR